MGVFHVFKLVQLVPNRAKHHIYSTLQHKCKYKTYISTNCHQLCCVFLSSFWILKHLIQKDVSFKYHRFLKKLFYFELMWEVGDDRFPPWEMCHLTTPDTWYLKKTRLKPEIKINVAENLKNIPQKWELECLHHAKLLFHIQKHPDFVRPQGCTSLVNIS